MDRQQETGGTREQAMDVCLRLLTARSRTRAELIGVLARKGFRDGITDEVLARLAELGLVDDEAFAREWVRSRHEYAGKGRQALAVELRRKGVEPDTVASALSGIDSDAERDRAGELVRKKLRTMAVGSDPADRQRALRRLVGSLARRGYSPATALSVARDELARHGAADVEFDDLDPDD